MNGMPMRGNLSGGWLLRSALLAGLLFRLAGLSHDLDEGRIYHPDTPKQMRAVERFLNDKYYVHTGLSDYDGYPLFHAHVIEYANRMYQWVATPAARLLGLEYRADDPGIMSIYWMARALSVLLATLTIWLVFLIGRDAHSRRAGLVAAWLLALSPVDMASAHYETGDTTASFFAVLTVFFAIRIYHHGRLRDSVWAGLSGMCAFASKYHAGMGLIPVGLAHLLRQPDIKALFGKTSFKALLILAAACIAGFFLAIPSMFIKPGNVLQEIAAFLGHVSSGERLPEEFRNADFFGRFAFSMHRHLPILAGVLSWPVCACSIAGLIHVFRGERRMAVLYAMPLIYFLIGVTMRPLAHPVYHTLMTPLLFVITAIVLVRIPAPIAAPLLALSAFQLGAGSLKEAFYFLAPDTRRSAGDWAYQNIPRTFDAQRSVYAFSLSGFGADQDGPTGTVFVSSSIRPQSPPSGFFPLKRFHLEDEPIPFFRNPTLEIHLNAEAIDAGFAMPVFAKAASDVGDDMSFEPSREMYRSQRLLVADDERSDRLIVSDAPIPDALLILGNGRMPGCVDWKLAGREGRLELAAGQASAIAVTGLKSRWFSGPGRHVYSWSSRAQPGRTRVVLALTPEEKGVALYNQGLYAEAAPWLLQAWRENAGHPTLAAMTLLALDIGQTDIPFDLRGRIRSAAEPLLGDLDAASVRRLYGIDPSYLRALPFMAWTADALQGQGLAGRPVLSADGIYEAGLASRTNESWSLRARSLFLDPGVYTLSLRGRVLNAGAGAQVMVRDGIRGLHWQGHVPMTGASEDAGHRLQVEVLVPQAVRDGSIELAAGPDCQVEISRMSFDPDPVATLRAIGDAVRVSCDGTWERGRASPMLYESLLAHGRRRALERNFGDALEALAEAARLRPDAVAPLAAIASVRDQLGEEQRSLVAPILASFDAGAQAREFHEAGASFQGGIRLMGYRVKRLNGRAGETLGLNLYWMPPVSLDRVRNCVVWMHFVDREGRTAFQGDHELLRELHRPVDDESPNPELMPISIPPGVVPGEYRVRVGLYRSDEGKRLPVLKSGLAREAKGVVLPFTFIVLP